MKMKFLIATTIVFCIIISNNVYCKPWEGPGRTWFKKAYKVEKEDPEKSVRYYRKAISLGLNRELKKAAGWRLFYLLKDLQKYDLAIKFIPRLVGKKNSSKLKNDIIQDAARNFRIDQNAAKTYIKAMGLARSNKIRDNDEIQSQLQSLLSQYNNNQKFKKALVSLSQENKIVLRTTGSRSDCNSNRCKISDIELLIENMEYTKANQEIYRLSKNKNLNDSEKFNLLYLLAKSCKQTNNLYLAVRYYRLASRFASIEKQEKLLALAAFSLYEAGLKRQARYLAKNLHQASGVNLHIFDLILKVELDHDISAKKELLKMKPLLLRKQESGKSKSLVDAALKVLNR